MNNHNDSPWVILIAVIITMIICALRGVVLYGDWTCGFKKCVVVTKTEL